jgi:hypothetical protein
MYCTVNSIFGGDIFHVWAAIFPRGVRHCLPNVMNTMERARTASLRSPSKPFSEHIIYVTRREDGTSVSIYRAAAFVMPTLKIGVSKS